MPYSTIYCDTTPLSSKSHHITTDPSMYRWQRSTKATTKPPYGRSLSDRLAYVEALVDMNAMVIEAIWPNNSASSNIVPLRSFIQEVLKRSRTTYSTLQTAFFYLFRARPAIVHFLHSTQTKQIPLSGRDAYIHCGRRMFLASLVVASKFVQDKTYRNSAWAKIAGLPVQEINASERVFLGLLDYRLYVAQATFDQWHQLLHAHVQAKTSTKKFNHTSSTNTTSNNSRLFQSPPSSPLSSSQYSTLPSLRITSSSSSSSSSLHSDNYPSLPLLRTSLLASSSSSSSLPALSPSSITSNSSNCSPLLMPTPPSVNNTGKRPLYDHDLISSYQSSQRKRPCSAWSTTDSS
ncbi:uncharacterized protein BX664DRAFT_51207 [Halteromyces radiatus]|uniref:uncharacterized protein n=1 Tax=Halteromyces radiatus TaxID=101107 RepID=UPI00221E62C2|nr:uncharacterized protein BX664DRAFT_51207 [Halteromyces radiatus]KAI8076351.1 hypothetical protein BX664DRAFT_51207 [Halteromyces radiatus]